MIRPCLRVVLICLGICTLLNTGALRAEPIKVAVAANFSAPMKQIIAEFTQATGHRVLLSFGSTGKLYAQIIHGAPYSLFLAADQARPARLVREGKAEGRFTYAVSKLVLWSKQPQLVDAEGRVLFAGDFAHLAIGNPKTAPYGAAAWALLQRLGLAARLEPRLVYGESIAQTYQFAATGNAELGLVALAQLNRHERGSRWIVPQELYDPIRQDAVLLMRGTHEPAALALMDYLQTSAARAVIKDFGYGVE